MRKRRWSVDSLGWQGLNGRSLLQATAFVADRVVAAARPGQIVLMHVGSNPDDHTTLDAAALPSVIDRLAAAGYRFVTSTRSCGERRTGRHRSHHGQLLRRPAEPTDPSSTGAHS